MVRYPAGLLCLIGLFCSGAGPTFYLAAAFAFLAGSLLSPLR